MTSTPESSFVGEDEVVRCNSCKATCTVGTLPLEHEPTCPSRSEEDIDDPELEPDPRYKGQVTPGCCEEMRKTEAVFLAYPGDFLYGDFDMTDEACRDPERFKKTPPGWYLLSPKGGSRHAALMSEIEAKCCPFCGKPLPALKLRAEPPEKVVSITDGGYYCDTCHERLECCVCANPVWLWEPVLRTTLESNPEEVE